MAKVAVLVTGSRDWNKRLEMRLKLDEFPQGSVLIHGGARGADMMADEEGKDIGFQVIRVDYYGWLGQRGGQARNSMLIKLLCFFRDAGYECYVVAFHEDLTQSKGTAGCMIKAKKKGFEPELIGSLLS